MTTDLGRLLDPVADKLLVAASLLVLAASGTISGGHVLAAAIILAREFLVSGVREALAERQETAAVAVTQLAKWKTTAQMTAIALLLAGPAGDGLVRGGGLTTGLGTGFVTGIGLALLWLAAVLTVVTGYGYLRTGLRIVTRVDPTN